MIAAALKHASAAVRTATNRRSNERAQLACGLLADLHGSMRCWASARCAGVAFGSWAVSSDVFIVTMILARSRKSDRTSMSERREEDLIQLRTHVYLHSMTHRGRICFKRRTVNLSQVFAGQQVGVRQVDEHMWLVTFMRYDIGYFDDETCRLEPIDNPLVQR